MQSLCASNCLLGVAFDQGAKTRKNLRLPPAIELFQSPSSEICTTCRAQGLKWCTLRLPERYNFHNGCTHARQNKLFPLRPLQKGVRSAGPRVRSQTRQRLPPTLTHATTNNHSTSFTRARGSKDKHVSAFVSRTRSGHPNLKYAHPSTSAAGGRPTKTMPTLTRQKQNQQHGGC